MLIMHLFVSYAHVNLCHFFSSSWCRGLAAASTLLVALPGLFYLPFFQVGNRSQGDLRKRYKDIKASLKDFNIPPESGQHIAMDLAKWRCLIRKGADDYVTKIICGADKKRKERKAKGKGYGLYFNKKNVSIVASPHMKCTPFHITR